MSFRALQPKKYLPVESSNNKARKDCEICLKLKELTSLASFWYLYYDFWTYFTPFSVMSIVDFEQINIFSEKPWCNKQNNSSYTRRGTENFDFYKIFSNFEVRTKYYYTTQQFLMYLRDPLCVKLSAVMRRTNLGWKLLLKKVILMRKNFYINVL